MYSEKAYKNWFEHFSYNKLKKNKLKTLNQNLTLEEYKNHTLQEFLKGDEKFFSIILNIDRNYFYNPEKENE